MLGTDVFLNRRLYQYSNFVYELSTANTVGTEVIQTLSNSMHKRLGELQWQVNNLANAIPHKRHALWVRNINSQMEVSDNDLSADVSISGLEIGYDYQIPNIDYKYGDWFVGALAQIGYAKPVFNQKYARDGDSDINTQALGLYAIWLGKEGWFADAVVRQYQMKQKVHSYDNYDNITKYRFSQNATNATFEFGRQIVTSDKCVSDSCEFEGQWFVTPRAQLAATILRGDTDYTNTGYKVKVDDNESYRASMGVITGPRFWGNDIWLEPYVKLGIVYEFDGKSYSYFDNIKQKTDLSGLRYELGGGIAAKFSRQVSAHADINWQQGEDIKNLTSNVGLRYEFGE